MTEICAFCNVKMWNGEKLSKSSCRNIQFSTCCLNGKVFLSKISQLPPNLLRLFTGNHCSSFHFLTNIRAYNAALSFTSLGININNNLSNSRSGNYTFQINGQVHHRISSLLPTLGETPKFAQLYIHDSINEIENRHNQVPFLDRCLLMELQDIVHTYNPFASQFLRVSSMIATGVPNISLNLKSTPNFDVRYCNKPTSSEIAVLLPGDGSDHIAHRDIILKTLSGPLRRINELHSSYDPLQYVLLFPRGDIGYHPSIHYRNSTNKYVTCREYYTYRFMVRQDDENVILRSKRLFHQFIVDSYAKQKTLRLNFIRNNQSKLRAELYQGIHDSILEGDTNADNLGRRIILPSSFTGGSRRHMHQLYQDAMAIVRCFGKPSLFITFTCNPKWDEIMRELFPHQTPNDHPDLVCRVFRQKLKCLKKDLLYYHVLGKVIAYIDVIEFQKRGLHCHMCLILDKSHRLPTADTYDDVVCSEIPNKITESKLFQIISNFNTHGPCGITFPNSPCMIDGKCSKKYPKSFVDTSSIDKYGYPLYRPRNDGVTFQKKIKRIYI
ncbi:unnamed protein product [Gordionus sp. m RMFG-2023]